MIKDNIQSMLEISKNKEKLMDEFYDLTKEQNKHIRKNDEDMSVLEDILSNKSKLIKRVDKLDKDFIEEYEKVKEELSIESLDKIDISEYPDMKDLKIIVERISTKLRDIFKLDKENNRLIKTNMAEVKMNLKNIKGVKQAKQGYKQQEIGSIMIDERK